MLTVLLLILLLILGAIPFSAFLLSRRDRTRGIVPLKVAPGSMLALTALLAVIALVFWWLFHPVCVPLSQADVREFARWAPIETRTDRQLLGPVFRQRDGRWYQCKSWVSRQLFF